MKKQLSCAIVGYGNRGQVYADYSLDKPEELAVKAIVDPNPFKLEEAKERYHLPQEALFSTLEDFLKAKLSLDFVADTTMDQLHYATAIPLLKAHYNLLLEKPIVPNKKELLDIRDTAKENGCLVFVCHVLRYTPFYRSIKQLISQGTIGKIITIEMNEHVCLPHYLTSYLRGKWNTEEACGSGFLLAKSCHDLDLMCWLNNSTKPTKVASFGSREWFVKANKPKEATEFCYQCPLERKCPFSAIRQYIDMNIMPFLVWDGLNEEDFDKIPKEKKLAYLKTSNFGRCAFLAGGDIVDRQNAIFSFANGSLCSFTLSGGTAKADRYLHIVGEKGEIEGKVMEDSYVLRTYDPDSFAVKEETINVSNEVVNNAKYGGHSGGDFMIMHDLCAYLNGDHSSPSITSIDDSINGHLCVYAAEESRKKNKIVTLD